MAFGNDDDDANDDVGRGNLFSVVLAMPVGAGRLARQGRCNPLGRSVLLSPPNVVLFSLPVATKLLHRVKPAAYFPTGYTAAWPVVQDTNVRPPSTQRT